MRVFSILVSTILLLTAPTCWAAEVVLYDGVLAPADADNGFYWVGVPATSPADWLAPDDFVHGEWHARYEIIEQPSSAPSGLQSCVWQDGKGGDFAETCSSVTFLDGPGSVAYTVEEPSTWWEKADSSGTAGVFDWSRGDAFVDIGTPVWHRLSDGSRCLATIASWGGCEEHMAAHLPMTLRLTIVIVSAGSTFSGWANYEVSPEVPDEATDVGTDQLEPTDTSTPVDTSPSADTSPPDTQDAASADTPTADTWQSAGDDLLQDVVVPGERNDDGCGCALTRTGTPPWTWARAFSATPPGKSPWCARPPKTPRHPRASS